MDSLQNGTSKVIGSAKSYSAASEKSWLVTVQKADPSDSSILIKIVSVLRVAGLSPLLFSSKDSKTSVYSS